MFAAAAALLLAPQAPAVELDSPVQPAAGSAAFHGTATVSFSGEIWSDWIEPGAWAIRDSAGELYWLGVRPKERRALPLPEGADLTRRFSLAEVLKRVPPGPASLMFAPEPGGVPQRMAEFSAALEVNSAQIDFGDRAAFPDARLEKVAVQLEAAVGGEAVGTMTIRFWPKVAPVTVRNFVRYAAEGFYDGLGFHRVIKGFMIQGGDPTGTGGGDGPHGLISAEFVQDKRYRHRRGVLSMARAAEPNSASCQFFICHGDAAHLDGKYAAFGKLVAGDAALDAVAGVAVSPNASGEPSLPDQPCVITKMRVFLLE